MLRMFLIKVDLRKTTDLQQMLWDMGNRCQERSKEIASVCEGPAEVGHHDNVMKAISTAI